MVIVVDLKEQIMCRVCEEFCVTPEEVEIDITSSGIDVTITQKVPLEYIKFNMQFEE